MQVGAGGHHSQKKPALSIHGVKENARDGYLWQHLCSGARNLCWVAGLAVRQQFGPAQGRLQSEISVCLWLRGFPGGSDGKGSACSAGDPGSIPGLGRPLEKEMATHSSVLAWKIPWTEDPGRLQSMGSQRVGHDWASLLSFFPRGFLLCRICAGHCLETLESILYSRWGLSQIKGYQAVLVNRMIYS